MAETVLENCRGQDKQGCKRHSWFRETSPAEVTSQKVGDSGLYLYLHQNGYVRRNKNGVPKGERQDVAAKQTRSGHNKEALALASFLSAISLE